MHAISSWKTDFEFFFLKLFILSLKLVSDMESQGMSESISK